MGRTDFGPGAPRTMRWMRFGKKRCGSAAAGSWRSIYDIERGLNGGHDRGRGRAGGCGGCGSARGVFRVADGWEERRLHAKAEAEIQTGWVQRKMRVRRPEVQLIPSGFAAEASIGVLRHVHREVGGAAGRPVVQRAQTAPLIASHRSWRPFEKIENAADGNEGPQGSIVEAGHSSTTLLSGSRGGRDEFYFRFPCGLERWPRYDLPSNR